MSPYREWQTKDAQQRCWNESTNNAKNEGGWGESAMKWHGKERKKSHRMTDVNINTATTCRARQRHTSAGPWQVVESRPTGEQLSVPQTHSNKTAKKMTQTFRKNILPPSSALKMEAVRSSRTSVPTYMSTRRSSPEDRQRLNDSWLARWCSRNVYGNIYRVSHKSSIIGLMYSV
jgi:hypothetical protein